MLVIWELSEEECVCFVLFLFFLLNNLMTIVWLRKLKELRVKADRAVRSLWLCQPGNDEGLGNINEREMIFAR